MFARSERFVEKIEITPGPNQYDLKQSEDDVKRFGFLNKTKRFQDTKHEQGGAPPGGKPRGLYERNALSASSPSLVIDDDGSTDTSIQSGSTTPDYTRKPSNSQPKNSDKLGQAFAANSNRNEERLKRELAELTDRFEKYRIARQKEMDVLGEKHKKTETMYQSAVKDKGFIQKQLHSKEAEIAELNARYNTLRINLEKSEKAATSVNDRIGKSNQLQKKVDELETLLSQAKASLETQESISNDVRQKSDQEIQELQQQLNEQKELAEQEAVRVLEQQRDTQEQHDEEMKKAMEDMDAWQTKFHELEKLVEELRQKLEAEQKTTEELRERLSREREDLQAQIDRANETIQRVEQEKQDLESAMTEKTNRLQQEKDDLERVLQGTCKELEELKEKHRATEATLEEQRALHADSVKTMTRQYEEQQAQFAKEHQEHLKERQDLEQSIAQLTAELDQNRDTLLKVQEERATLQIKYVQSQLTIQEMSSSMAAMEEQFKQLKASSEREQQAWAAKYESLSKESASQYEQLKASSEREQQAWAAKYESLSKESAGQYEQLKASSEREQQSWAAKYESLSKESAGQYEQLKAFSEREQQSWTARYKSLSEESTSQKQKADAAITELEAELEKRNGDYSQAMTSIETIQAELKVIESQRDEISAQKMEEEKKAVETFERLSTLQQENSTVLQELSVLVKDKKVLESECDEMKTKAQAMEQSIKSLETEVDLITAEAKENLTQKNSRIEELENMHLEVSKNVELYQEKEKAWETERTKASVDAAKQDTEIKSLQSELARSKAEKDLESKTSAERIQDLEGRCRAMESAFLQLFEKSGSAQVIDQSQPEDMWKQHSAAVLDVLTYHTTECSISKSEHAELLEQMAVLERSSAALQEQESKNALTDHAGLLAKIAELEEQIRQLNIQLELLEAENIGKEAIIKALQDEYDYQEKLIRDLSKNEDAGKEIARLEEELRILTNRTRETDEWIKQVREDNEKYREAYLKADMSREETLLDMAKLHEELAESEQARLQARNQLQVEVNALIKKHGLSPEELSRLSKMNTESTQNLNLRQKVKQVAQLKEENLALKKKNISLANTRDSLRLKCLQIERDLEGFKLAGVMTPPTSGLCKYSSNDASSSTSSLVSSSSGTIGATDQSPNGKLQLQGLVSTTPASDKRSRSTSPGSAKTSNGATRPPLKSRAARSYMAGPSTTN